MEKIAVINISSFGRENPEIIEELEFKVGKVTKFTFDPNINGVELSTILQGYTFVILGNFPNFGSEFFENNKSVRMICRHGLGFNNIDLVQAKKYGVCVTKISNTVEAQAVAEHAVSLLHVASKRIVKANIKVRKGEWAVHREDLMGIELKGLSIGIIGFGHIGRTFANILKRGYGCKFYIYDPAVEKNTLNAGYEKVDSLTELFRKTKVISIHCALNDKTINLLNSESLVQLAEDAIIINTSRGAVINETDIASWLSVNYKAQLLTDVVATEPIPTSHPFLPLDNVILTPHIAIYNKSCILGMNRSVVEDILNFVHGQVIQNRIA